MNIIKLNINYFLFFLKFKNYIKVINICKHGDWGLGIGPNPQSPIPNPQSPIPIIKNKIYQIL